MASRCLKAQVVQCHSQGQTAGLVSGRARSSVEPPQGQALAQGLLQATLWPARKTNSRSHATRHRRRSLAFRSQDQANLMVRTLTEELQGALVSKTHHLKTISLVQEITEESTRNWDQLASKDRESTLVAPQVRSQAHYQKYSLKTIRGNTDLT